MAYTVLELKQHVQDKINAARLSTWSAQNDVSYWRGLHHKYDQQLLNAVVQYKDKGKRLIEEYKRRLDEMDELIARAGISIVDFKSDMRALVAKVLRLADKYWAVRYEIEGRQKGFFVRKPVGTTYYIDLNTGNDANDGLSISTAWLTIEKYTSVTVRSAGDIGYVRANTTETQGTADINFDEHASLASRIYLIGCDATTNDPWGDASDIKPIINRNAANYRVLFDVNYWTLKRLVLRNSIHQYPFWWYASNYSVVEDCEFKDHVSASVGGVVKFQGCSFCLLKNPVIKDNEGLYTIFNLASIGTVVQGGTLDGKATGNSYGVLNNGADLTLIDTEIGQTQNFSSAHWSHQGRARTYLLNVKYVTAPTPSMLSVPGFIFIEDKNQVYGDCQIVCKNGYITKDATVKTGNANFSLKLEPDSGCGLNNPLSQDGIFPFKDPVFAVKLFANVQKTLTIKLQANAWTAFPTADELYIEASYYSSATTAVRSTIKSTQVISAADTWTDFSVTLTPLRDGVVYINCYLRKYESAKTVSINGEVVIS